MRCRRAHLEQRPLLFVPYDRNRRFEPELSRTPAGSEQAAGAMPHVVYTLPLPKVPTSIKHGRTYLVVEVIFAYPTGRRAHELAGTHRRSAPMPFCICARLRIMSTD